jgi:methionyl-tRNA formyltransferase
LRIIFAGTPAFAARALEAIVEAGHSVPLVLTQPDRPAGRGQKLRASAVALLAGRRGLPLAKPQSLIEPVAVDAIRAADADVMVVVAYGLILPTSVLAIPRRGCLNVHASLLPRWRGAAPVQRAILAGDAETGIAIMLMEPGLDTGPVLLERRLPIARADTAGTLTEKLAELGARAVVDALAAFDTLVPRPQDEARACYAPKVQKSEAPIDWGQDAVAIERQVRAFNPFPGAEAKLSGEVLKVWEATAGEGQGQPGTVVALRNGYPVIACSRGLLVLTTLQRPGSRRISAADFVRGRPISPGTVLK